MLLPCIFLQAELKVAEYNKLGRKLKLIPQSAENACGHDFEIRTDYSATTITQYKTQIQVQPLQSSLKEASVVVTIKDFSYSFSNLS